MTVWTYRFDGCSPLTTFKKRLDLPQPFQYNELEVSGIVMQFNVKQHYPNSNGFKISKTRASNQELTLKRTLNLNRLPAIKSYDKHVLCHGMLASSRTSVSDPDLDVIYGGQCIETSAWSLY